MKKAVNTATGRVESASSHTKDNRPKDEYQCPVEECAKTVTWACGATSLKSSPHFRHLPGEGKGCPGNDELDIDSEPGTINGNDPTAENHGRVIRPAFPNYLDPQRPKKLIEDSPETDPLTGATGKHHAIAPAKAHSDTHDERIRQQLIALTKDRDAYRGDIIEIAERGLPTRRERGEDVFIPFADLTHEHVGQRIFVYGPVYSIKPFELEKVDYPGFYINSGPYRPNGPGTFSIRFVSPHALDHFDHFSVGPNRSTSGLHAIAYGTISEKGDHVTPTVVITDHRMVPFIRA